MKPNSTARPQRRCCQKKISYVYRWKRVSKDKAVKKNCFKNRKRVSRGNLEKNKIVKPVASVKESFVCTICSRKKMFIRNQLTARCKDKSQVCPSCLRRYINERITTKQVNQIRCICQEGGCPAILGWSDIWKLTPPDISKKYLHCLAVSSLEVDPSFRWCSNDSCKSGQFIDTDGPECTTFLCCYCKKTCCINHDGQGLARGCVSCQETYLLERKGTYNRCPRCRHLIEKNGGCDHMACRCGQHFTWKREP